VLVHFIYIEINLNIKDGDEEYMDRRLGKGLESIDGRVISRAKTIEEKTKFASTTFHTWLSGVKVEYTIVKTQWRPPLKSRFLKEEISVGRSRLAPQEPTMSGCCSMILEKRLEAL
jgi:hypothetical protein